MEKAIRPIFLLLVFASLMDFWLTNELIQEYGFVIEANPLLYHWMVQHDTSYVILAFKLATFACLLIALILASTFQRSKVSHTRIVAYTAVATLIQLYVVGIGIYMVFWI